MHAEDDEVFPPGSVLAHARKVDEPADEAAARRRRDGADPPGTRRPSSLSGTLPTKLSRSLAVFGMYVALYVLCGFYVYHREPRIADELEPAGDAADAGRASR